jgi:TDG/mug DNA glycosylase family protein
MLRVTIPTTRARRSRALGFTREELEAFHGAAVPDLIGHVCNLLFVGINPGLWTAATQTHFCHPSNRFYPALREAGLIDWSVDPDTGMTDDQRQDLEDNGIGITNLVNRATVRASELSREELHEGGDRLADLVEVVEPAVVAVAGVTAFREAFGLPRAQIGRQESNLGSAQLWAVPNPSGLNAHETIASLARWYAMVAGVAGIK